MMASAQRQPCLEAFLNPCSLQLNFQSNKMALLLHPPHTMKISLYLINVFEPQPAWYQKLTVLLSHSIAGQGQYKKSIYLCLYLYYKQSVLDYYLKMGCVNTCTQAPDIQLTINLQYCKKILQVVLDTLYAINRKFSACKIGEGYKLRCGIDSSFKDMKELKIQLEITVMIFSVARDRTLKGKFPYDDNLSKEMVERIVEQNIKYFQSQDIDISKICKVLIDVLRGEKRSQVQEWMKNINPENPEKTVNKKVLKEGMKVTLMKEEIEKTVNNNIRTLSVGSQ